MAKEKDVELVKGIAEAVSQWFASKGLHVIDGKFEPGMLQRGDDRIVLIDEISPDVLRVCRWYAPDGRCNCTVYGQCTVTRESGGKRTIKNRNQVLASEFVDIFL